MGVFMAASEDFVSFNIMRFFIKYNWSILQYHSPGGQACFAINVYGDITYPDLIAYKAGTIVVLENKARFNNSDIEKLRRMQSDEMAIKQIKSFVGSFLFQNNLLIPKDFIIYCGHGYTGKERETLLNDINLLYVDLTGEVKITQANYFPLKI